MKTALVSFARLGLGVGLLALVAGCEAQDCDVVEQMPDGGTETRDGVCLKSLTRFDGTNEFVHRARWLPGAPITIDGRNGDIEVVQGTGTDVVATFDPFVWLAHDSSQERVQGEFDKLNTEATGDVGGVSGAVLVRSSRDDGAKSTLGADIRVEIPPGFDGALAVQQDNGTTEVAFAGSATSVKVHSDNGSCRITSSATATEVDFHCENGTLTANVSGAPAGAGTRSIRTDLGDINLSFVGVPASQPFNVQAFAPDGIVNTVNDAGAGCTVNAAAGNSKTISCHAGTSADPVFQVNANSLSDITLTF